MTSHAPSLLDLYKKVSNPTRTNANKIHLRHSPFVGGDDDGGYANSERSRRSQRSQRSQRSRRSQRSQRSQRSRRSQRSESSRPKFFSESPDRHQHSSIRSNKHSQLPKMSEMDRREVAREKLREKTVLLHELSRMELSGSKMARDLSIDDPLADIEFELNRTRAKEDCVSTVSFMKDAIRLGVTGIELLNNRFNVLKLQGWSGKLLET